MNREVPVNSQGAYTYPTPVCTDDPSLGVWVLVKIRCHSPDQVTLVAKVEGFCRYN